jgi:hypothetical protein
MATKQYKTIMDSKLYPKRWEMFDTTLSNADELKKWEKTTSKEAIANRNKSFSAFN